MPIRKRIVSGRYKKLPYHKQFGSFTRLPVPSRFGESCWTTVSIAKYRGKQVVLGFVLSRDLYTTGVLKPGSLYGVWVANKVGWRNKHPNGNTYTNINVQDANDFNFVGDFRWADTLEELKDAFGELHNVTVL